MLDHASFSRFAGFRNLLQTWIQINGSVNVSMSRGPLPQGQAVSSWRRAPRQSPSWWSRRDHAQQSSSVSAGPGAPVRSRRLPLVRWNEPVSASECTRGITRWAGSSHLPLYSWGLGGTLVGSLGRTITFVYWTGFMVGSCSVIWDQVSTHPFYGGGNALLLCIAKTSRLDMWGILG
jgi:hypothetical protein